MNMNNEEKIRIFYLFPVPFELEGTEEQIRTFLAIRKQRDKELFPRGLSYEKQFILALTCGLTIIPYIKIRDIN